MGILVRKSKGIYHPTGISKLALIGLITSLSAAYVDTIWAVYLDSFLHSEVYVGFLSSFLTVVSFLSFFFFVPVVEKSNKEKLFSLSIFLLMICYLLFAVNPSLYLMLGLAVLVTIIFTFKITVFGIIVKESSQKKNLSRNEGVVYAFRNLAWVLGPIIAGYVAVTAGISWIFVMAAGFLLLSLLVFRSFRIKCKKPQKKVDSDVLKNFFNFFRNKDRAVAYVLGSGVTLWWALVYIFIPLEIVRNGLSDLWVGYFLFAVAVPLILFEYTFSNWAGKHGFSKIFKIGFLSVAVISLICFLVTDIFVILALLVLASVGIAMVEPTSEAYFFDVIKDKEIEKFYGPYNTAIDTGGFVGRAFPALLLIFLPFKFTFLLFALLMFFLFVLSFKTKKIIEDKKH